MPRIALATAISTAAHDEDLVPLLDACTRAGLQAAIRAWDDPSVAWGRFDAVLLRSTWDYTTRLDEFLGWCRRTAACTQLINPLPIVAWNTDKHYLADLEARGVPIVPTTFVAADDEPLPALEAFLARHDPQAFVVKPTVGAGARGAQRFARGQAFAAANHLAQLLQSGRAAMLQPYLAAVDRDGESALVCFDGQFSHAIVKAALLGDEAAPATESISARAAREDERAAAAQALQAAAAVLGLDAPPAYARVDLIRDDDDRPRLLELELCEPSLFLAHAAGSADRLARKLADRLG